MDDDWLRSANVERRGELKTGMALTGMNLDELWLAYAAVGGRRSPRQLAERLDGDDPWPPTEVDVLVVAVNDRLLQAGTAFRVS